jgi:hypothetical protein
MDARAPVGRRRGIKINRVVNEAPGLLGVLEQYGRSAMLEFDEWTLCNEPASVAEAARALRDLGVTSAIAFEASDPGLWFGGHGGGMANPDRINVLVVERARAKVATLSATPADERHLFVWIVDVALGGELAMHAGVLPSGPPELPTGIDVVWAASSRGARVWRARPPSAWEVVGVPEEQVEIQLEAVNDLLGLENARRGSERRP